MLAVWPEEALGLLGDWSAGASASDGQSRGEVANVELLSEPFENLVNDVKLLEWFGSVFAGDRKKDFGSAGMLHNHSRGKHALERPADLQANPLID